MIRFKQRGTVRRVVDEQIGEFDIPGLAGKFSRWTPSPSPSADALGAHNEDILRSLLNLSDDEIRRLYVDKTLVRDPLIGTVESAAPRQGTAAE